MTGTSHIRTGVRAAIATAVLVAAFALPAQAFAGTNCSNVGSDPTQAQYCPPSAAQAGGNDGTGKFVSTPSPAGTEAASTSGGSLPFTGLDLAVLLAVAAVLTATGLALRRLSASGGRKG